MLPNEADIEGTPAVARVQAKGILAEEDVAALVATAPAATAVVDLSHVTYISLLARRRLAAAAEARGWAVVGGAAADDVRNRIAMHRRRARPA